MAIFLSDDFDGADGITLGSYNPNWRQVTGQNGVNSLSGGTVRHMGGSTPSSYYRIDAPAPSADYAVSADVRALTSISSAVFSVSGRVSSTANTGYRAVVTRTGVDIARSVNGANLTLASSPYSFAVGSTVNLRLEMRGSLLQAYVNGELYTSVEDTTIMAAGFAGMRSLNGNNVLALDNLVAATFDGPGAATYEYTASGGFAIAGVAVHARTRGITAAGGLKLSGAAAIFAGVGAKVQQVIAAGGIALSGIGRRVTSTARAAAGGLRFSGSAAASNSDIVARATAVLRRRTRPRQPVSRR